MGADVEAEKMLPVDWDVVAAPNGCLLAEPPKPLKLKDIFQAGEFSVAGDYRRQKNWTRIFDLEIDDVVMSCCDQKRDKSKACAREW